MGLRAGGARQQPARALGLHSHGCRRLRDPEGEPRGLPAAHASPPATRSGCDQARYVGPVVRSPLGHAAVPVPGRGARGVSHRGRERRRQGGARAKDPPDPVEQQFAVVRSDRRGEGRAALVPDLHGPRLEHEQEADRPRRGCGLSRRSSGRSICSAGATGSSRGAPSAARSTTGRFVRIATTTSRATSGRCAAGSTVPRDPVRRTRGTTSSGSRTPRA